jgi:hypothetical protein
MKIAVLIYGQPRLLNEGFSYLSKFFDGLKVDYFVHLWGNESDLEKVNSIYNPKKIIVEKQIEDLVKGFSTEFEKYSKTDKTVQVTLSPLYSMMKAGELLENDKETYDAVVLTRTDVAAFGDPFLEILKENNDKDTAYINYMDGKIWEISKLKRLYKNKKAVDTKFIYSSKDVIIKLTKIFKNLDKLVSKNGIYFCHHRLFYFTLSRNVRKMKLIKLHNNDKFHGWHWIRKSDEGIYLAR